MLLLRDWYFDDTFLLFAFHEAKIRIMAESFNENKELPIAHVSACVFLDGIPLTRVVKGQEATLSSPSWHCFSFQFETSFCGSNFFKNMPRYKTNACTQNM